MTLCWIVSQGGIPHGCRLQLENGEFEGIGIICTRNRCDTVTFLIQQLESFQNSFNPMRPPTKTREQLKLHINEQMKAPTFLEYLRLRSQPGIGDVKAMKVDNYTFVCLLRDPKKARLLTSPSFFVRSSWILRWIGISLLSHLVPIK
jgi:hypothetical protein